MAYAKTCTTVSHKLQAHTYASSFSASLTTNNHHRDTKHLRCTLMLIKKNIHQQ